MSDAARRSNGRSVATNGAGSILALDDKRGYPERTFPIEMLPIDASHITFRGEGQEPLQRVDLNIASGSSARSYLEQASKALAQSHLVAFPTETVYGLGANALDPEAVSKIFKAKGRPTDNPLIVHISDLDMLKKLLPDAYTPSRVYTALMADFWPGAMTLLFPVDEAKVPSVVRCGLRTLGVRMPSHKIARALIASSGLPLAAPSANASGRPSPTLAQHVLRDMTMVNGEQGDTREGRIPYIIDGGACDVGVESTVIDGISQEGEVCVLRPGGVGVEEIKGALARRGLLIGSEDSNPSAVDLRVYGRDMQHSKEQEANPTTPGMKYKHYSPDAEVVLLVDADMAAKQTQTGCSQVAPAILDMQDALTAVLSERGSLQDDLPLLGVMSMDDSDLTRLLFGYKSDKATIDLGGTRYDLQRYSLGSSSQPQQAARLLFQGLRWLDGGDVNDNRPACAVIFVEAQSDESGVGLAIMNRLRKAASKVLTVRCKR